jgi:hypothetical protein
VDETCVLGKRRGAFGKEAVRGEGFRKSQDRNTVGVFAPRPGLSPIRKKHNHPKAKSS